MCVHCSLKTTKVSMIYHLGVSNICTKCQNVLAVDSNSLNKLRRLKCAFEICKTRPSHLRYVHVSKDRDTQVLNMCVCVSVQADAAVWHIRCDQRWSRYFLSVNDGSEQCATLPTAGGVHCQAGSRRGELVSLHVNVKLSHVTAINNVVLCSL